jgi:hypothetical protein
MTRALVLTAFATVISLAAADARAAKVTVNLGNAQGVTMVGAIQRWDADGNPRKPLDLKAKIDIPAVDAKAVKESNGRWVFKNLPKGKYDLVILAEGRRRIEGFQYVPVKDFDPFFPPDASVDDETRELIVDDIKKSPQYENIVMPLHMAGDKKAVRVLMMLICDRKTSYEEQLAGAATIRHEVWQFSWNYGGWLKEKRTKVMDRAILNRDELRKWTWLWDPKLGGIDVGDKPVSVQCDLPNPSGERTLKGLYPY